MVLNSLKDSHTCVIWGALDAIGTLAGILGPNLQNQYHKEVILGLVEVMNDFNDPRLQVSSTIYASLCDTNGPSKNRGNFVANNHNSFCCFVFREIVDNLLKLAENGQQMLREAAMIVFRITIPVKPQLETAVTANVGITVPVRKTNCKPGKVDLYAWRIDLCDNSRTAEEKT
ncbi:hypothetical protein L1987_67114 [Smallanthus sonchifolius]|uniref:Uncharacterized protein n=1 Tax=Smallanthus sonchifolius TaxID=185202 RepID=A0ACB9BZ76_9ASTR|nr:hypothetical protein L1987_67114 [Smallanthus sonchifolius]